MQIQEPSPRNDAREPITPFQWMGGTGVPADLRERLKQRFFQTADWMRNTSGGG